MIIRAMKNNTRVGKRFRVVQGDYLPSNWTGRFRWWTRNTLSEHDTLDEARHAAREWGKQFGGFVEEPVDRRRFPVED